MTNIIKDFKPFIGQHCETTATGSLLKQIGIEISEPMLFGLVEGLGFIFWNMKIMDFRPVYLFEDESLHELSNDTVHGLIHVGWTKKNDNNYTATLAIYVIPRGIYGKVYLKLIEPFRRHIVYPGMMKAIKELWQEYLVSKG